MTKIIGYKWTTSEMKSSNGGETWKLEKWKIHEGDLKLYGEGLHACRTPLQSLEYIRGDRWFVVEADGYIVDGDDKFVCNRMRLVKELPVKKILVRFAIECAKRSLEIYEKECPDDDRPRKAVEAAELYIGGKITKEELEAAAEAAWAARATARTAEAAWAAEAAAWAAWVAVRAAWAAARAAEAAAEATERKWQNGLLEKLIKDCV